MGRRATIRGSAAGRAPAEAALRSRRDHPEPALGRPDITAAYAVRLFIVAGDHAIIVDISRLRFCGVGRIEGQIASVRLSQEGVEGFGIVPASGAVMAMVDG